VFAQGPEALRALLADALEDGSHEMNTLARLVIQRAAAQWAQLDAHLAWCDERIAAHARDNAQVRAAGQLMGVQVRRAVRRLVRPGAAPALQRRQDAARADHATRRQLPAQPADPGRQVGGV
jgi:hypothetical protein